MNPLHDFLPYLNRRVLATSDRDTVALPASATATAAATVARHRSPARSFRNMLACGSLLAITGLANATSYYVANSGNDSNTGTSSSTPWKTITKLNTKMSSLLPGDGVWLNRGDVFTDAYILCQNLVTATSSTTLTTNPPKCSGNPSRSITIGSYGTGASPVINGADALTLSWTLVTGTTYRATVSGTMPTKLFVDAATKQSPQLLPVANYEGTFNSGIKYNPYDMVLSSGSYYVRGPLAASSGLPLTDVFAWVNVTNTTAGNTSQTFAATSGLANVEATPGSWYGTGSTIYVNLADGSNPSAHTFQGTRRAYGVLLEGVNYVTVENLVVEHTQQSGIASVAYSSDHGSYFVGEYNKVLNTDVWNYGGIVTDNLPLQDHTNLEVAGILMRASGAYDPHELRGILISGNYVGTLDTYFGLRGAMYQSGIAALGMDGGGTANNTVIASNIVTTINGAGITYNTTGLYYSSSEILNNGGRVTGNKLTNNQGNLYFTATTGGLDDHNTIYNSYGEGVQTGGNSVSTTSVPQVHSYNLIYNLGKSASGTLYNGFDCNGNFSNGYWTNNTVYNTFSASITLEYGCTYAHVHNNIFDQNALAYPANNTPNSSYLMYWLNGGGDDRPDFANNVWYNGTYWKPFFSTANYYTCSTWPGAWPDTTSTCGTDPMFTNPSAGVFTLQPGSPAIALGAGVTQ